MNRYPGAVLEPELPVPRRRGDEPVPAVMVSILSICSPQARG